MIIKSEKGGLGDGLSEGVKRVFTSLIGLPVLLFSLFYSGIEGYILFFLIMLFVSFVMGRELLTIIDVQGIRAYNKLILTTIVLIVTCCYLLEISFPIFNWLESNISFKLERNDIILFMLLVSLVLVFFLEIRRGDFRESFEVTSVHIFIIVYASIGIVYIIAIQQTNSWHFLYILVVTWMTDSGAYFAGKYLGRTKLNLKISPKKTLEGFIGGIICGTVSGVLLKLIFVNVYTTEESIIYSYPYIIIVSLIFTLLAILGDLAESLLKRSGGVKNSDKYIPGHGGMLDVMDSLIFNAPIFYILINL